MKIGLATLLVNRDQYRIRRNTVLYNTNLRGQRRLVIADKYRIQMQYSTVQYKSCRQQRLVITNKYKIQMQYSTVLYNTNRAGNPEWSSQTNTESNQCNTVQYNTNRAGNPEWSSQTNTESNQCNSVQYSTIQYKSYSNADGHYRQFQNTVQYSAIQMVQVTPIVITDKNRSQYNAIQLYCPGREVGKFHWQQ